MEDYYERRRREERSNTAGWIFAIDYALVMLARAFFVAVGAGLAVTMAYLFVMTLIGGGR
jgi:hypothetical protein